MKKRDDLLRIREYIHDINNNVAHTTFCVSRFNNKTGPMLQVGLDDLQQYLDNRQDIYFIPNLGGTKQNDIHNFRVFFIDFDMGRDKDGKYYKPSLVDKYKSKLIECINARASELKLAYSFLIETRNGFQVYWKLKNNRISLNRWNEIEHLLLACFSDLRPDWKVKKANQLLRVPFSWWSKPWENKQTFYTVPRYSNKAINYSPAEIYAKVYRYYTAKIEYLVDFIPPLPVYTQYSKETLDMSKRKNTKQNPASNPLRDKCGKKPKHPVYQATGKKTIQTAIRKPVRIKANANNEWSYTRSSKITAKNKSNRVINILIRGLESFVKMLKSI